MNGDKNKDLLRSTCVCIKRLHPAWTKLTVHEASHTSFNPQSDSVGSDIEFLCPRFLRVLWRPAPWSNDLQHQREEWARKAKEVKKSGRLKKLIIVIWKSCVQNRIIARRKVDRDSFLSIDKDSQLSNGQMILQDRNWKLAPFLPPIVMTFWKVFTVLRHFKEKWKLRTHVSDYIKSSLSFARVPFWRMHVWGHENPFQVMYSINSVQLLHTVWLCSMPQREINCSEESRAHSKCSKHVLHQSTRKSTMVVTSTSWDIDQCRTLVHARTGLNVKRKISVCIKRRTVQNSKHV